MLNISYAGCLGLSSVISAQFTLKLYASACNLKKYKKTYIGDEFPLRSLILTIIGKYIKRTISDK